LAAAIFAALAQRRQRAYFINATGNPPMNIKAVIHEAEEGGFWAEVPAIPGCATQGGTMEELVANQHEAIEGCLSTELSPHY
jgi:predicted RNase H-like HicB family nuclease